MARFRLELGPIPLHHQVYLDLKAALDEREWRPGDRLPTERDLAERYGCSLITVRRALERAGPRAAPGADPRPRHVRPASAHRPRLRRRPVVLRGDADARPRPGDAADRGAARVRGRGGRRGARPRARLADALPRAAAPRRRRAAAARAGPPAGRALPRAAGLGPRARLPVRPARPSATASGSPRAREVLEPVLLRAREARLLERKPGTPALLIEGIASTDDGTPVELGRTFVRGDRTRYYVERVVVRPRWMHAPEARIEGGGRIAWQSHDAGSPGSERTHRRNAMRPRLGRLAVAPRLGGADRRRLRQQHHDDRVAGGVDGSRRLAGDSRGAAGVRGRRGVGRPDAASRRPSTGKPGDVEIAGTAASAG